MDGIVGNVYETFNYGKFKFRKDNREIMEKHVIEMVKSIKRFGQLKAIEVDSEMVIQDGQHRFLALKQLGLPVRYIFVKTASIDELAAQNSVVNKWKPLNFIRSKVSEGNQSYGYLNALIEEFPDFSLEYIFTALGQDNTTDRVKNGTFNCTALEYAQAQLGLGFVRRCQGPLIAKLEPRGKRLPRVYTKALLFCFRSERIDEERLAAKIKKYGALVEPATNVGIAVKYLDKVYNYRSTNVVDIELIHKEYIRNGARRHYAKRRAAK